MASSSASAPTPAEPLRRNHILSSRLYFDVPGSKAPVVYSPAYDIAFLGIEKLHSFDSSKWRRIYKYLTREGHLEKNRVVEPLEASKEDLLVVHSEPYLNSLKSSFRVASIVEVPPVSLIPNWLVQQKLMYPFRKLVGGSILTAKLTLGRGWAINVGGGFHYCSAEEGGGFCAYADISLCIQFAFVRLNISRKGLHFGHSGTKTDDYLDQVDKALKVGIRCEARGRMDEVQLGQGGPRRTRTELDFYVPLKKGFEMGKKISSK